MERVRDNSDGKHQSLCLGGKYAGNLKENMSLVFYMLEKCSQIDKIQLEEILNKIHETYSKYGSLFDETKDAFEVYFNKLIISRP
jgi:hypothetical protein